MKAEHHSPVPRGVERCCNCVGTIPGVDYGRFGEVACGKVGFILVMIMIVTTVVMIVASPHHNCVSQLGASNKVDGSVEVRPIRPASTGHVIHPHIRHWTRVSVWVASDHHKLECVDGNSTAKGVTRRWNIRANLPRFAVSFQEFRVATIVLAAEYVGAERHHHHRVVISLLPAKVA